MTSLTSGSSTAGTATAFEELHPRVQSLVRQRLGWRRLTPVQQQAIPEVLRGDSDVLVIAGTASGKTEAAWLPIFSDLLTHPCPGIGALCVSPLKALIDDQAERLTTYGRHLGLRVDAWHGDVSASRKNRTLSGPPAALIITPESLQGALLHKRPQLAAALQHLRYVVVDEVHAFAGTDRGHQLSSLLHQVELLAGRRVVRVALSATVSTPHLVAEYLRPGSGPDVTLVRASGPPPDLDVHLRGLVRRPPRLERSRAERAGADVPLREVVGEDRHDLARLVDQDTRGKRALVFAGSRVAVEETAVLLADPEVTGTLRPGRFFAHHGSLSRELRKAAEQALHEHRDTVTVCTSTLELGVDLPALDLVVQVDTCLSVAGLRQRLGRSGRRGDRPVLRAFSSERAEPTELVDVLRTGLVQTVAGIELIVSEDWVEPADVSALGLSTLVHQVLCLLSDPDGTPPAALFDQLCGRGPWRRVTADDFRCLLRALASQDLVRQDGRGLLLLDEAGLRLTARRDFLAVFATPTEYVLRHAGKQLGTLPVSYPLGIGSSVAFGGRTWQVAAVHGGGWVVDVVPHRTGLPPRFWGSLGSTHERVRQEMRALYAGEDVPAYLDPTAQRLLGEGRAAYRGLDLPRRSLVAHGDSTLVALWTGDRELATISRWVQLRRPGAVVAPVAVGLVLPGEPADVAALLRDLLRQVPTPAELAEGVVGRTIGKYDHFLPDDLLTKEYASRRFDVPRAVEALERALAADRRG